MRSLISVDQLPRPAAYHGTDADKELRRMLLLESFLASEHRTELFTSTAEMPQTCCFRSRP